jgi:hypothetical protein
MVYWRFINAGAPSAWRFGYCTYHSGHDLVRMGDYNGDDRGGSVVNAAEIEWRPH